MMSYTRNVMVPYFPATLGAVAGRSCTDLTREVNFQRTILISLRLQCESR